MKTLEEVNKHLLEVGYTHKALDRIVSFLIGAGVLEAKDYEIECIDGDNDFQDFLNWYNSNKCATLNEAKELEKNIAKLKEIMNDYAEGHPFRTCGESLIDLCDALLKEITCDENSEGLCLDKMEVDAHNALDNIFASLHEGKLDKDEHKALEDSMIALIALGCEYED